MLRPPRTAVAVLLVAGAVVLAAVAPAVAATDAAATGHAPDGDSLDATSTPAENATVDAWRAPAYVDAANASASELATYANATTSTLNVTPRDRLVVDVTVPGLDARVANASGNAPAKSSRPEQAVSG
jgi:hypothetical protein